MMKRCFAALFLILCIATHTFAQTSHDGWTFSSVRTEIAPIPSVLLEANNTYALVLKSNGQSTCAGKWAKKVPVTAGAWVSFNAKFKVTNITEATRLVMVNIVWLNSTGGKVSLPEWPAIASSADSTGHRTVKGVYQVPTGATHAQLELHLRWDSDGTVEWRSVSLTSTTKPATRSVKIATVNHRPQGTGSPTVNLSQFATYIDQAAANGAKIVCLPEATTFIGTGKTQFAVAEPIPGTSTNYLGTVAARNQVYIVAGLYERSGTGMYNVAVLIGKDGKLIGKYRKVCLPREEVEVGFAPGSGYPVFNTEYGKIGMMICWDVTYPEVARGLFLAGAEMIFMPIWGGDESLTKARAVENQTYVIISGYDIRSAIYDRKGIALAKAPTTASTVVYATIDLSQRTIWSGLGDWRSRIWFEGPKR